MNRALIPLCALAAAASCSPEPEPVPTPAPVEQAAIRPGGLPGAEVACLARTAYHEARGEGRDGMAAVIHVVLNRAESGAFPDTPCSVAHQGGERGCQFSWTCDGHPDLPGNLDQYDRALRLTYEVLRGEVEDPTGGATMFHTEHVSPYWAKIAEPTTQIGEHVFYVLN